jgi:DNA-binding winged helix-turn-helix (wHTH) protein
VQFIFDNHALNTERRELLCGGAPISVQPQVFDLLVYLV